MLKPSLRKLFMAFTFPILKKTLGKAILSVPYHCHLMFFSQNVYLQLWAVAIAIPKFDRLCREIIHKLAHGLPPVQANKPWYLPPKL